MKKSYGPLAPKSADKFYDNGKLIPEKDLEHMVIFMNDHFELLRHLGRPDNEMNDWKLWQFDLGLFLGNIVLDESKRPLPRREYAAAADFMFPYNVLRSLGLAWKFNYEVEEYIGKPGIKVIGVKFDLPPLKPCPWRRERENKFKRFIGKTISKAMILLLAVALFLPGGCGDVTVPDADVDMHGPVQPYCFDSVESIEEYCHIEFGATIPDPPTD